MTRRGWLLVCSSVLCVTVAAVAVYGVTRWRAAPRAKHDAAAESELFQLINAERSRYWCKPEGQLEKIRLPLFKEDKALQQVAQAEAENMGRMQRMVNVPEEQLRQETQEAGYPPCLYVDCLHAVVFRREGNSWPLTVSGWMSEPKHEFLKGKLLHDKFSDIGIGVYRDGRADAYYVFILLGKQMQ